jgi:toxin ParE1/3/4
MPGLGSPWESDLERLQEVRYCIVTRFKYHVVFYREIGDAVEIVRLLHASRDLEKCLQESDK